MLNGSIYPYKSGDIVIKCDEDLAELTGLNTVDYSEEIAGEIKILLVKSQVVLLESSQDTP